MTTDVEILADEIFTQLTTKLRPLLAKVDALQQRLSSLEKKIDAIDKRTAPSTLLRSVGNK